MYFTLKKSLDPSDGGISETVNETCLRSLLTRFIWLELEAPDLVSLTEREICSIIYFQKWASQLSSTLMRVNNCRQHVVMSC